MARSAALGKLVHLLRLDSSTAEYVLGTMDWHVVIRVLVGLQPDLALATTGLTPGERAIDIGGWRVSLVAYLPTADDAEVSLMNCLSRDLNRQLARNPIGACRSAALATILLAVLFRTPTAKAGVILYACDAGTQQLFTLNPSTGSATFVGGFAVNGFMAGLAYDSQHDVLFGSETQTDSLYRINRATGAATLVGGLGVSLMHGIAFDSTTGTLYGSTSVSNNLYRVNTSTGAATLRACSEISI